MKKVLVALFLALLVGLASALEVPGDSDVIVTSGDIIVGVGSYSDGVLELELTAAATGALTLTFTNDEGETATVDVEVDAEGTISLAGDGGTLEDALTASGGSLDVEVITQEELDEELAEEAEEGEEGEGEPEEGEPEEGEPEDGEDESEPEDEESEEEGSEEDASECEGEDKCTGLDRADQAAGENGAHGREVAREVQENGGPPSHAGKPDRDGGEDADEDDEDEEDEEDEGEEVEEDEVE